MIDVKYYVKQFEKDYGENTNIEIYTPQNCYNYFIEMWNRLEIIFKFMIRYAAPIERTEFVDYLERIFNSILAYSSHAELNAEYNHKLEKETLKRKNCWFYHPIFSLRIVIQYHTYTKRHIGKIKRAAKRALKKYIKIIKEKPYKYVTKAEMKEYFSE